MVRENEERENDKRIKVMSEKIISHILLKFFFFLYSKNSKNNILLFSEFSIFFNFVFKNCHQKNNTKHLYLFSENNFLFLKIENYFLVIMLNIPLNLRHYKSKTIKYLSNYLVPKIGLTLKAFKTI